MQDLTLENQTLKEELRKSQFNEKLMREIAKPEEETPAYIADLIKTNEKMLSEAQNIFQDFMNDYYSELHSLLSINAELLVGSQKVQSELTGSTSTQIKNHPLERLYNEKLDKLKSRVSLLMRSNLDLGQKLTESLVREKSHKQEIETMKRGHTTRSNDSHPRATTREKLLLEQRADILSGDTDHLCELLIDLQIKIDEARETHSNKLQEIEKLDKRHDELQQSISNLMAYESELGYDKLKDVSRNYKRSVKEFDEVLRRNQDLENIIRTMEYDRENKIVMIEKISKESKLLLFLNHKLAEELNNYNSTSYTYKYSREYFRKKKLATEEEEMMLSFEEMYDSVSKYKADVQKLILKVDHKDKEISRLDAYIRKQSAELAECKRELEIQRSKDIMLEKNSEQKEGEMHELIETLNSSLVSDENAQLKESVRRLVDMNNCANLVIVDRDIEIAKLKKSNEQLTNEISAVLEALKKTSIELMEVNSKEVKALKAQLAFSESEKESLKIVNSLYKERATSVTVNLKQVAALLSKESEYVVPQISPLIRQMVSSFENFITTQKVDHSVDCSEVRAAIWRQKEDFLMFKVEALSALNSVLENKCTGLEKALDEYFRKVNQLEKERESMEVNSVLEKTRLSMMAKGEELEQKIIALHDLITTNQETKRQREEEWATRLDQVKALERDSRDSLHSLTLELNVQVERAIEKCNSQVNEVKAKCQEVLKAKEDEISGLKARLEGVEFEGRAEMLGQVEQLLAQNYQLRKEVVQLEAATRIHEANVDMAEEMAEESTRLAKNQLQEDLEKLNSDCQSLKQENENLKAEHADQLSRVAARCKTLESSVGLYSSICGELLTSLRSMPGPDDLKTAIAAAESRLHDLANLT